MEDELMNLYLDKEKLSLNPPIRYATIMNEAMCPHARPIGRPCPHCMGINNTQNIKECHYKEHRHKALEEMKKCACCRANFDLEDVDV